MKVMVFGFGEMGRELVDECLEYVEKELNYNKAELLGTDDMSNIYLLKR